MFIKIFLFSLILISTKTYSSLVCEDGFSEETKIGIHRWGENTLGRTLNKDELYLLEVFYRENLGSEAKEPILRRHVRDFDEFNFSEREIKILSQREIRPEFTQTVKIKIPEKTQEEKELKAQGFNAAYRRGIDEVNEWIAVREQLVRVKADPYLTHVDYFAKKMKEHIAYIEEGITTSAQARNLNRLKQYAKRLIDKKQVTYYRWLMFSLSLSKILDKDSSSNWYRAGYSNIHRQIIKTFPTYMAIPTTIGEVGIIAINKGSAHGVHPLGLIKGKKSLYFFSHDTAHYMPDQSSGFIYIKLMKHTKKLPLDKRKNIELAYFILTHEGEGPIKLLSPHYVFLYIEELMDLVLRPDNKELRGLIDLSHDRDKKVQTLIDDFLETYQLIERDIARESRRMTQ